MKKQFLLAKSRTISTNLEVLGLNLHSSSPKPVNFFGAKSSLGGHKQSFEGVRPWNPPYGAGPEVRDCRLDDRSAIQTGPHCLFAASHGNMMIESVCFCFRQYLSVFTKSFNNSYK